MSINMQGYDSDWQTAYEERVEYQDLPLGDYTFQVRAVDRNLNYSEAAEIRLSVVPDPRDERIDELEVRVRERTRELEQTHRQLQMSQQQLIDELEKELQTAYTLQMGLMPTESPKKAGLDIAGRYLPATHVGGDFFQYFDRMDNRLSISLADVTGHAMEAAVPVMMFSGILETEMRLGDPLEQLFGNLNGTLHSKLDRRTFICFTMGEYDLASRTLRLSNSGCPYPYHYQTATQQVVELEMDAYPLGIRPETTYQAIEVPLAPGDRVVLLLGRDHRGGQRTGDHVWL